jgi:hypothetical protein
MPFKNANSESQRDSDLKPRVARNELSWESEPQAGNPKGVTPRLARQVATPLGLKTILTITQGSSLLATLGWVTQSLWDCSNSQTLVLQFQLQL